MLTVNIVLNSPGADTGPFNLYSDADGYTTSFDTNVPKSSLVLGYTSSTVPDGSNIIRAVSTSPSVCSSYINIPISGITTTTTTTLPPITNGATITNHSSNTISSGYVAIIVNGVTKASFALPSLSPGSSYTYSTTYTSTASGNFEIRFYTPNSGISTANYFNMTNGTGSTNGYFANYGSDWRANVLSSGYQVSLSIQFY